jgi:hypothetical protein
MTRRLDRAVIGALAAVTALYLVVFGYFIGATALRVPVGDVVFWITHYLDHWLTGDWWGYLWIDHNGHRLLWSRLLMIPMLQWMGGSVMPFILFGIACFVIMIGALVLELKAADLPAAPRVAIMLAVVLLLATTFNGIDCGAPQLGVYLHTCAFVVLALVLWDGKGEGGRYAPERRIAALVAAILAGFGVNGGLMIWPVLCWASWRGGLGWRWLAAVFLVGVPFGLFYLHGLVQPGVISTFDGETILRMGDYLLRLFGLPWSHSPALVDPARLVGLLTVGCSIYAVLRFGLLGAPRSRLDRIAVALLMFSFLIAALIIYGRLNTAPDRPMPIRYALFTSLAQVGLLLLAAPAIARFWDRRTGSVIQGALLIGAVLFLVQQVASGRAGAAGVLQYTNAYRAFEAGHASDDQKALVVGPPWILRVLDFAHAGGLFQPER